MKVLMLGWEFPPMISGGLGVACKGIADAISNHVELNLILPKTISENKKKYKVIGIDKIFQIRNKNETDLSEYSIPYYQNTFFPYLNESYFKTSQDLIKNYNNGHFIWNNIPALYGNDIIRNINTYKKSAIKISEDIEFDIIHAHDWMTMTAGIEIKKKFNKPLVLHIHSLETDRSNEENRGYIYQMEKKGMKEADLILAVSDYTKNKIIYHYQIKPEKIEVAHNGNNYVPFQKSSFKKKETTVAFIGRLTNQKGPRYFLDIAKKILESNTKFRFVIAGNGDNMNSLIEYSALEELGDKIHYTGFLNENKLKELWKNTDIYCMPSVSEPFGLSAVEAASCNIPCVISKQSGVSEVLKNSLQFDFWDVDKAASLIINLAENKMLKKEITTNALKEVKKMSWNKTAKEILKHYHSHKLINF